jgi:hypothetical protein
MYEQLFEDSKNVIDRTVRKATARNRILNEDELRSEAYTIFMNCAYRFNSEKGMFENYFQRSLRNWFKTIERQAARKSEEEIEFNEEIFNSKINAHRLSDKIFYTRENIVEMISQGMSEDAAKVTEIVITRQEELAGQKPRIMKNTVSEYLREHLSWPQRRIRKSFFDLKNSLKDIEPNMSFI